MATSQGRSERFRALETSGAAVAGSSNSEPRSETSRCSSSIVQGSWRRAATWPIM